VQEISAEAGISKTSCREILTAKFGIRRFTARLEPRLLNYEQKKTEIIQDI
jgi:hypothetical protein